MDETKKPFKFATMGEVASAIARHELKYHTRPNKAGRTKPKRYSEEFEAFWRKFTGRWSVDKDKYVKVGKFVAWQEWKKLNRAEQFKATVVADKVSGKYTPDANRWLKKKMFDDFKI